MISRANDTFIHFDFVEYSVICTLYYLMLLLDGIREMISTKKDTKTKVDSRTLCMLPCVRSLIIAVLCSAIPM